jgi:hypothetical protein
MKIAYLANDVEVSSTRVRIELRAWLRTIASTRGWCDRCSRAGSSRIGKMHVRISARPGRKRQRLGGPGPWLGTTPPTGNARSRGRGGDRPRRCPPTGEIAAPRLTRLGSRTAIWWHAAVSWYGRVPLATGAAPQRLNVAVDRQNHHEHCGCGSRQMFVRFGRTHKGLALAEPGRSARRPRAGRVGHARASSATRSHHLRGGRSTYAFTPPAPRSKAALAAPWLELRRSAANT